MSELDDIRLILLKGQQEFDKINKEKLYHRVSGTLDIFADIIEKIEDIVNPKPKIKVEEPESTMPYVDGKRFQCTYEENGIRCQSQLFNRVGNIYTCNSCGQKYEGEK